MSAISTAIGLERRAAVSGYQIQKGFYGQPSNNLPQQIVIFGEVNTANISGVDFEPKELVSADQAGLIYGYGSPIHQVMRILRPKFSDGVGGIPTIVIPQETDEAATATTAIWTITGAATKNKVHYVKINGRTVLDQERYAVSIVSGDTPAMVATKVKDVVSAILGAPVTVTNALGVITFVTKWKGATSAKLNISFDVDGEDAGLTYAETTFTAGAGVVSLSDALSKFEDNWYTTVINTYGESMLEDLEAFNGFPDDQNPTGRYEGRIFKPFLAFFGNTSSNLETLTTITNAEARRNQCTNVLCPAPNSEGFPWEAAANMVYLWSKVAQNTPHLDVDDQYYPDMPSPENNLIGSMSDYNSRDFLVKKGCSTVVFKNGKYQAKDLVTTYQQVGNHYCYPRNINIMFNFKNGYSILEAIRVKGHVIVADRQVTDAVKAVKPKEWKSVLFTYIDAMAEDGMLEDPEFIKGTIVVQKSETNPDRFETTLSTKITGFSRIQSTTVKVGF